MSKIHVGIVGFGALGQYLVEQILSNPLVNQDFELAFVQNRSVDKIQSWNSASRVTYSKTNASGGEGLILDAHQILNGDLTTSFTDFIGSGHQVDLVIEASHPDVIKESGEVLLAHCNLMITSLTSLANSETHDKLLVTSDKFNHNIFIPSGAGWGFQDIKKMADLNTLESLGISMKFHYRALKLNEPLLSALNVYIKSDSQAAKVLYQGSVRELAILAPNNVNTMCGLALAGHTIGFDHVEATLIASKSNHHHEVLIDVTGPDGYYVQSHRVNPARAGAVTGSMTFSSFLSSMLACRGDATGGGVCFV